MLQNKIYSIKFLLSISLLLFSNLTYNSDDKKAATITANEYCICFFSGFFPCCSMPALYGTIKETEVSIDTKILILQEHLKEKSSKIDELEKEVISFKKILNTNNFSIYFDEKIKRENNFSSFHKEEKFNQ